ncbi:lipoyl(octanoyl) transferase LipB [Neptuniibacter sp. PT8_73]|uniref:lipoyl(octanoyl) transferase LipB n=1 Tax=Neptuniibacter sp. PT8_73 TaxID=3398206 RepID=UPI0039F4BDCA
MNPDQLIVRDLGLQPYEPTWQRMQNFTNERDDSVVDEIWSLQHEPVFTQGQAGKEEHLLGTGDIPVVQVDRGGQVTYHGPGQAIVYLLLNLKRKKLGVRELVSIMEESIVETVQSYGIDAYAKPDAPGVYVDNSKIASLGLRVRRGCSFHGLAFNLAMDLEPFLRINPCGYAGMAMTQLDALTSDLDQVEATQRLLDILITKLGYKEVTRQTTLD